MSEPSCRTCTEKHGQERTKLGFNCKHLTSQHPSLTNTHDTPDGSVGARASTTGVWENGNGHSNINNRNETMANYIDLLCANHCTKYFAYISFLT